jgi:hypothetical protein
MKKLRKWVGALLTRPKPKPELVQWAQDIKIVKVDDEKQIVYGPVLEPNIEDAQGDVMTPDDIEAAAHRFMLKAQLGKASADGVNHQAWVGYDKAHVVESWITTETMDHGDDRVLKGTWMIGVHLPDPELWAGVKSGEFTGFSIGGRGVRV